MQRIIINEGQQSFNAGEIRKHKDRYVVYFNKRPLWLLLRNIYYDEVMQDEFPNQHYKAKHQVPIYTVMKNGKKAGSLFPRTADNGKDFLYCPVQKGIKKEYYIWDLKKDHIISHGANIMRML